MLRRPITRLVERPVQMPPSRILRTACVPTLVMFLAAASGGLAGCASHPTVSGSWADGAQRSQLYQRVLVVGVSPDIDQRCPFERFLAARIKDNGTAAIVSCDVMDLKAGLSPEAVKAAVVAQKADAVVATNLVAKQWDVEEGGTMDTRGGGMYKATDAGYVTGYYGAYGMPVIYGEFETVASIDTLESDVSVATRFFAADSAKLLYSMETVAPKVESRIQGLDEISTAIADRLRKNGLIR